MSDQPNDSRVRAATRFDQIAQAAIALLFVLPFANPIHTEPIPSFYSEWLAALLALLAVAATLGEGMAQEKRLAVPGIVALPLLLALAMVVQAAFGHVAHQRQALLFASALVLAAAMMVVGHSAARSGGFERMAPLLARVLVAGSLLQGAVLLLQRAGIGIPWLVSLPAPGASPAGLLGQANHVADYLWLGVASALYLMTRVGRFSIPGVVLVLALAAVSVIPASRSVLLYPLGLALVAALGWRASGRRALWRQLGLLCLATLPLMLVADQVNRAAVHAPASGGRTLGERLAGSGGDNIRAGLYRIAAEEAMARPLTGHGLGAAPSVSFERADRWPAGSAPVVAEHAHNIVLQWLLEFGVPLTLLALALVLHWLWRALPTAGNPGQAWALGLLTVMAIHSQLEYPLWLAYFLLPAAWLMAALGQPSRASFELLPRHLIVGLAGVTAACLTLVSLQSDYRQLEVVAAASAPGATPMQLEHAINTAIRLEGDSMLAPQAVVLMAGAMGVSREGAADKWALCKQALRISPTRDVALKCAAIAAIAGEGDEARRLLRRGSEVYGSNPTWPRLQADFHELQGLDKNP